MGDGKASSIEIHEDEDWAAVYVDGNLVRVGDAYLADEWLRTHFGVKTVQDDAFMRGQTSREGVAKTLDEVLDYARSRQDRWPVLRPCALRRSGSRTKLGPSPVSGTKFL